MKMIPFNPGTKGACLILLAVLAKFFLAHYNEDANHYSDKINSLEQEQMEFLRLSKEQITVVKSTLRSLNSTLLAFSDNEKILSKGLEEMAKHINKQDGEVKRMFTALSIMLTVNEHLMQLNSYWSM